MMNSFWKHTTLTLVRNKLAYGGEEIVDDAFMSRRVSMGVHVEIVATEMLFI